MGTALRHATSPRRLPGGLATSTRTARLHLVAKSTPTTSTSRDSSARTTMEAEATVTRPSPTRRRPTRRGPTSRLITRSVLSDSELLLGLSVRRQQSLRLKLRSVPLEVRIPFLKRGRLENSYEECIRS
ncbi:unnamed protein product [Chondrus crispus]|uniref:Uncharacterized protein n=1 Tax=Chondrus crispus TaxID=2769 RepID=R7Q864_CHOCR|nr:unnamed protein product [Chondrus crispus]CDF33675.1 unnamed protein product [Chondrus crispus]|eukprot:XP_005713494.1 unnamed protein product [Chondrus crispus]